MSLASGTKIGPYEIVASIGAGGMGEVDDLMFPRLSATNQWSVVGRICVARGRRRSVAHDAEVA